MKVAEKINDEYCVEGSAWQVNFKGEHAATIEKSVNSCKSGEAKDVEEDLFDSAQDEVYQLMLLDLYPAFVDHIAILGGGRASEEEKGPDTLMDILGGINPAGMRSFERSPPRPRPQSHNLFPSPPPGTPALLPLLPYRLPLLAVPGDAKVRTGAREIACGDASIDERKLRSASLTLKS